MSVQQTIRLKLETGLDPLRLEIVDESHLHAGHSEASSDGESHFHIEVVSIVFQGKGRAERHRLVYKILASEISQSVHALSLRLLSPEEETN